jgi:hypothetical protein
MQETVEKPELRNERVNENKPGKYQAALRFFRSLIARTMDPGSRPVRADLFAYHPKIYDGRTYCQRKRTSRPKRKPHRILKRR